MIIHTIDIRESGPDGLIAILEPHDFPRAGEAEARRLEPGWDLGCYILGCSKDARSEIIVHRRHSKRLTESAYLCSEHITAHQDGTALRLVVESNR